MNHLFTKTTREEWLKVLGKGMVTLPKKWRDEMGIVQGDVIRAKKEDNKVIIESPSSKTAPYRVYSKAEIAEFLKSDKLSRKFSQKVQRRLSQIKHA